MGTAGSVVGFQTSRVQAYLAQLVQPGHSRVCLSAATAPGSRKSIFSRLPDVYDCTCRGVGTGAAGAAKAAPIIFEVFIFIFYISTLLLACRLLYRYHVLHRQCGVSSACIFLFLILFCSVKIWPFRPNFQIFSRGQPPDPPLSHTFAAPMSNSFLRP